MSELREYADLASLDRPVNGNGIPAPAGKLSYEEFLDWADEDTHAEWVDGELEMPSPASFKHQAMVVFLYNVVDAYLRSSKAGGQVQIPFQMKLPEQQPGREPDLVYVNGFHENRWRNAFIDGPADLVVEVVSPESQVRDRQTKFAEYAIGGVAEYWLIDPVQQSAEFYQLNEAKQYQQILPDDEGRYYSREISGLWLRLAWLWQKPLPSVEEVLREIGGAVYRQREVEQILDSGDSAQLAYLMEQLKKRGLLPPQS